MFYDICQWFMIFFIASVIGYFIEIFFCSLQSKKLIFNRGFLIGPYIPIYGVGTVLVAIFLYQYKNDPWVFFWMTVILCSFVEYLTSYTMEKIFKVRWWDYSHEPFNFNGRICLQNSMIFGIAGLLVIYTIYPFICHILTLIPTFVLEIITILFAIIFLTDLTITTTALIDVRSNLAKFKGKDVTNEARGEVIKAIKKHNFFVSRILQAFPRSSQFNRKEFSEFRETVIEYRRKKKELRLKNNKHS